MLKANDIQRIAGVSKKQYKRVQWHTSEVVIKQILTMSEYIDTVHSILDNCLSKDGHLIPELFDFAAKVGIIMAYAFVELPEDINDLYYCIYASDLYDAVCSVANKQQVASIVDSAKMYFESRVRNE